MHRRLARVRLGSALEFTKTVFRDHRWHSPPSVRLARGAKGRPSLIVHRPKGGPYGEFPQDWTRRSDLPVRSDSQVVAAVHVYYPELLDEILGHLAQIPASFDLIITNASGVALSVDANLMPMLRRAIVLSVENRGRDLWPLAQVVNAGLLDQYDLVVKVHTKQSQWRDKHRELTGTGESWRGELLAALLGDNTNVSRILKAFAELPDLGMVTADGSVLGPEYWGGNLVGTAEMARRLGLAPQLDGLHFAAGSMYWARAMILRRLRFLNLRRSDFENERGQVDGTTAHSLERVIGLIADHAGWRIVERSRLEETHPLSLESWGAVAPASSSDESDR